MRDCHKFLYPLALTAFLGFELENPCWAAGPISKSALQLLRGSDESRSDAPREASQRNAPAAALHGGDFVPAAPVIGAGVTADSTRIEIEGPALTAPQISSPKSAPLRRGPSGPAVGSRFAPSPPMGLEESSDQKEPQPAPSQTEPESDLPPAPSASASQDSPPEPSTPPTFPLPPPQPMPGARPDPAPEAPAEPPMPAAPGGDFKPPSSSSDFAPAAPGTEEPLPLSPLPAAPEVVPAPNTPAVDPPVEIEAEPPVHNESQAPVTPLRPLTPPVADGDFPALPPDPNAEEEKDALPPLSEELWDHGGSYLYSPEGDHLNWPDGRFGPHAERPHGAHHGDEHGAGHSSGHHGEHGQHCSPDGHGDDHHEDHYDYLRLPEWWVGPQPLTIGPKFLGTGPIIPHGAWPGCGGYDLEPRFVGAGSFRLFGFGLHQNQQEQVGVGGHLVLDLDLRLTGTERFHVQFRPLGREGTGGSYYEFTDPSGVVNNSTGQPDLYWFEGEIGSMFGAYLSPFAASDYTITVGRFPFLLHNTYLINDEFAGVVLNKNNLLPGGVSNLNLQLFYAFDDVDAYADSDSQLFGAHATIDYKNQLYEATYAYLEHEFDANRDAHFFGLSRTQFIGNYTVAGRVLGKLGDEGGRGDGALFVLETNKSRVFDHKPLGIEHAVFYCNGFAATKGWTPIAGGGFNRLTTAFETNPLIRIAAGRPPAETVGLALGVQLFRLHDDESFVPEIAVEAPDGQAVFGMGMRYLRKTGSRSFFEALGVWNISADERYNRAGLFLSETILF